MLKNTFELNKIYNEDCLITMQNIPDNFIDIIFTSPPYNLGNDHHTYNKRHFPYEDNIPEEKYQEWQKQVLNECYRVLKTSGSMFYNHKNRIKNGKQITPYEWLLKTSFIIKQELVWFNGSHNFDKIRFYPMTERIYWLAKDATTKLYNTINHHDLFTTEEWPTQGIKGKHTRAFPIRMFGDILQCFPEANIIYDPFMGSGTVAECCKKLGKNYIGSEISKEYCKIAEKRLNSELDMFSEQEEEQEVRSK